MLHGKSIPSARHIDHITPQAAHTLAGLFQERISRTPQAIAYRYFDPAGSTWKGLSWQAMGTHIALRQGTSARFTRKAKIKALPAAA